MATYRADRSWDPRPGSTSILTLGDLSPSRMRIVVNWPAQLRARNFAGRAR